MEAIAHVIRLEHKDGWSLESLDWNHLKHGDTSSCDRIGGTNQSQQGELKKLEEPHQETSCECDSGPIQDPTAVSRFRIRHVETSEGRAKLTFRRTPSIDLARVVHDLRTPLAAIVSAAERLQTEALAPAVVRTEAVTIGRAGRGLLAEVESLLALDRGQAGTPASTALAGAWDPRAVAAEVVELLAPTARSKGLILRLADVGSAGLRRGDAVPFRRIVMNLVGNAVKFSDRGSIVVTLGSRQGTIVVSVRDEGPGIEPDAIPNLFEPGFRGTRASGIAGHGLGLANVRDLVTGMGGSIRVESRPGDGATFIVELPETVPAPRLDGVRALLVEDCDDNRRLLHHHLRSAGAEVLLAPDGLAAESVARAARIDIVLLDLAMPGRGGIETLRVLRSFGVHAPAVALTASTDAETLERTRNAGFVRVLTKPVDPSTLRRELRAALAVRAAA